MSSDDNLNWPIWKATLFILGASLIIWTVAIWTLTMIAHAVS